ncbi:MAG: thioredoxin domain-containing protein [Promethearchaeota archaeon]
MNKLAHEKSPYLLQHKNNPVDWYPWGDSAFQKAREENKPIFLSIGYSTCHWCHVMAHESFEDEEVAKLMNEVFISIKVDREERPDIDNIYMNVAQMTTGRGGWPLTIFMSPDKKPFFAATYIPKENRFGMMGLKDLIRRIKLLWNTEKEKLLESADQITFALQNITNDAPGNKFTLRELKNTYEQLKIQFDKLHGGFSEAPKFPTPHNLVFLLRFWKRTKNQDALEMVKKTLQEMRKGGIYDQIGFGFHRYSTDSKWLVPHFEKMLYDQALIANAYIEAYQATKNIEYSRTVQEVFTYVLRCMTDSEGGFYSAEDADSEGEEGKFYIWTAEEIKNVLSKENAEIAIKIFNIQDTGNFQEESTKKMTSTNILYQKKSIAQYSEEMRISEQELKIKIEDIRRFLYKIREKRNHPHKDDKILTDWNGLMIAALAKGGRILCESLYINAAKKAVDFILSKLRKKDGRLLHRYRANEAAIDAYLTDYAFFIWGLIELYEATFEIFYLKTAIELNEKLIEHYWDDYIGGFYLTADDGEELIARQKALYDGAIPSGNSIAFLNLLRLSYFTGDHKLEEKSDILERVFAEKISSSSLAYTQFMIAVDFALGPSYTVVISGDPDSEDTKEMLDTMRSEFLPNKILIYRPTKSYPPEIDEIANYIKWFDKIENKATAYVCVNKTCKPPTTNPKKMLQYLEI